MSYVVLVVDLDIKQFFIMLSFSSRPNLKQMSGCRNKCQANTNWLSFMEKVTVD